MVTIRRGDVFWADGQGGRRPVAVITRDSAISLLNEIAVIPATRSIRGAPTEVKVGPADGMPGECVFAVDAIRLARKGALRGKITTLSAARLEELCDKLAYAFGC